MANTVPAIRFLVFRSALRVYKFLGWIRNAKFTTLHNCALYNHDNYQYSEYYQYSKILDIQKYLLSLTEEMKSNVIIYDTNT